MEIGIKKIKYPTMLAFVVGISPILNVYKLYGMPIGDIFLLILGIVGVLKRLKSKYCRNSLSSSLFYIYYLMYAIFSLPILLLFKNSFVVDDIASKLFHLLFYSFIALYLSKYYLDIILLKKIIKSTAMLSSIVVLVQAILNIFVGINSYLFLPFLHLNSVYGNYGAYVNSYLDNLRFNAYRPSALFLEPAHCCTYILIGCVLLLFDRKEKEEYWYILICLIGIVLTYSTSGIVLAIALLAYYYINTNKMFKSKKEHFFRISFIFFGIIGAIYMLNKDTRLVTSVISKFRGVGTTNYNSSGNIRVLRGWYIWQELPLYTKLFGTGIGCLLSDISRNNIMVLTDSTFSDNMNDLFTLLNTFGVVGFVLFFISLFKAFSNGIPQKKAMIILFTLSMFYNDSFYRVNMIIYLIFIFIIDNENKDNMIGNMIPERANYL